jgi:hypothetical protein
MHSVTRSFVLVAALAGELCTAKPRCTPMEAAPAPVLSPARAVSGVFVEPWQHSAAEWTSEVETMSARGIELVIVKGVQLGAETSWDEVAAIAGAARQHHMQVVMGLSIDDDFSVTSATAASLGRACDTDRQLAGEVIARGLPVDGWYIGHEVHNANDPAHLKLMHDVYLQPLAAELAQSHALIVISPFFNPAATPDHPLLGPAATAAAFADLVRDTRVSVVALQDGVGVRNDERRIGDCTWPLADFVAQAAEYGANLAAALPPSVELWWNAEAFGGDANTARFEWQRRIVPSRAARVVAYEWDALSHLRTRRPAVGR